VLYRPVYLLVAGCRQAPARDMADQAVVQGLLTAVVQRGARWRATTTVVHAHSSFGNSRHEVICTVNPRAPPRATEVQTP
jgi:hypothetical protein